MHQRNACSQETFSLIGTLHFKILSTRKLKTLFQKYKLELTTGIHACIDDAFVNIRDFKMPRQLTATKTSHEKWGGEGAGRVRETGGERAGSGRAIQKGKFSLFVTAYIQSKKRTQQRFLPSINVLRGLKQNFIREKSHKTKIRTRDKKQHYFRWNWKPFQVAYIIGHEWDGMTHVHVCRLCQSCQCLVRLA